MNRTIGELLRTLGELFSKISKTLNDLFKQLYDGFNERILPALKDSFNHIIQALTGLYDEFVKVALDLFHRVIDSLKKFEKDFKDIGKTASESFNKAAKAINETFSALQKEFEDLYKLVIDYIKSLPGLDVLKAEYDKVSEKYKRKK